MAMRGGVGGSTGIGRPIGPEDLGVEPISGLLDAPKPKKGPGRPAPHGESLHSAQTRKEKALASLRELELREKEGSLVARAAVEQLLSEGWVTVRDAMLALPEREAGKLAAASDEREVRVLLKDAIRADLSKLADLFAADRLVRVTGDPDGDPDGEGVHDAPAAA